jgi:hypothetical protein
LCAADFHRIVSVSFASVVSFASDVCILIDRPDKGQQVFR